MAYIKIQGVEDLMEIEPHEALKLTQVMEKADNDELISVGNLTVKKRNIQFIQRDPKKAESNRIQEQYDEWDRQRLEFIKRPVKEKAVAALNMFKLLYYAGTGVDLDPEKDRDTLIKAYTIAFNFFKTHPKRSKVDPHLYKPLIEIHEEDKDPYEGQKMLRHPTMRLWITGFIEKIVAKDMSLEEYTKL